MDSRQVSFLRTLVFAGLALIVLAVDLPAADGWRPYQSTKYGFRAEYPASWHLWDPQFDALEIFNFPRQKALHGVVLRAGGASISVIGAPPDVRAIDEWVQRDFKHVAVIERRDGVIVANAPPGACAWLTEVVSESDVGPPGKAVQVNTAYYCSPNRRMYRIEVTNWKGDPKQKKYQTLAFKVATTLRELPK